LQRHDAHHGDEHGDRRPDERDGALERQRRMRRQKRRDREGQHIDDGAFRRCGLRVASDRAKEACTDERERGDRDEREEPAERAANGQRRGFEDGDDASAGHGGCHRERRRPESEGHARERMLMSRRAKDAAEERERREERGNP